MLRGARYVTMLMESGDMRGEMAVVVIALEGDSVSRSDIHGILACKQGWVFCPQIIHPDPDERAPIESLTASKLGDDESCFTSRKPIHQTHPL